MVFLAKRSELCYDKKEQNLQVAASGIVRMRMEKITSFTIDHIKLQPGLYVSRKDKVGSETVTTFDLRLT